MNDLYNAEINRQDSQTFMVLALMVHCMAGPAVLTQQLCTLVLYILTLVLKEDYLSTDKTQHQYSSCTSSFMAWKKLIQKIS